MLLLLLFFFNFLIFIYFPFFHFYIFFSFLLFFYFYLFFNFFLFISFDYLFIYLFLFFALRTMKLAGINEDIIHLNYHVIRCIRTHKNQSLVTNKIMLMNIDETFLYATMINVINHIKQCSVSVLFTVLWNIETCFMLKWLIFIHQMKPC